MGHPVWTFLKGFVDQLLQYVLITLSNQVRKDLPRLAPNFLIKQATIGPFPNASPFIIEPINATVPRLAW